MFDIPSSKPMSEAPLYFDEDVSKKLCQALADITISRSPEDLDEYLSFFQDLPKAFDIDIRYAQRFADDFWFQLISLASECSPLLQDDFNARRAVISKYIRIGFDHTPKRLINIFSYVDFSASALTLKRLKNIADLWLDSIPSGSKLEKVFQNRMEDVQKNFSSYGFMVILLALLQRERERGDRRVLLAALLPQFAVISPDSSYRRAWDLCRLDIIENYPEWVICLDD